MTQISRHITLEEATISESAVRAGIPNIPDETQLANMQTTANMVFEPLRTYISDVIRKKDTPIHINSFFRSVAVNGLVGGSATSQHCKGQAMDLSVNYPDFSKKDLFNLIKTRSAFDQLIWEAGNDDQPAWVHVSYNKNGNRKQILKAIVVNGSMTYIPFV
jgi:zinc D-Ala-D-Ala carboxypeptidase